jgi:hypothetical protein
VLQQRCLFGGDVLFSATGDLSRNQDLILNHDQGESSPRERDRLRSKFFDLRRVGALLIGVGIGVGVGLLSAPAHGEEMRSDIADRVSDFSEKGP